MEELTVSSGSHFGDGVLDAISCSRVCLSKDMASLVLSLDKCSTSGGDVTEVLET